MLLAAKPHMLLTAIKVNGNRNVKIAGVYFGETVTVSPLIYHIYSPNIHLFLSSQSRLLFPPSLPLLPSSFFLSSTPVFPSHLLSSSPVSFLTPPPPLFYSRLTTLLSSALL